MVRTNPWPKMPPGSFAQSSFSRAWTKRVLMRVALVSSSMEASSSWSWRFRRSPKAPLDMNQNLSLTIQAQPRKRSFTWATAKRSFMSAAAKRLTRRALTKKRLGIPRRHYRQVIRCCQTERKWEIDERGRVLGNEAPSGLSGKRRHTEGVRHLIELGVDAGAVYNEGDEDFDVAKNSTELHVSACRAQD